MSMGDGSPKLRIWLMMSAGRKPKVTPGKSVFSAVRSFSTYCDVGLCLGLSVTSTSASALPIGDAES